MQVQEFYKTLEQYKKKWIVFDERGEIRTSSPKGEQSFCPITYVAYKMTGKKIKECDFEEAAKLLKLRLRDAYRIASAADQAETYPAVRRKLMQVLKPKLQTC